MNALGIINNLNEQINQIRRRVLTSKAIKKPIFHEANTNSSDDDKSGSCIFKAAKIYRLNIIFPFLYRYYSITLILLLIIHKIMIN